MANDANSLVYDIEHLTAQELTKLYGIEFFEDPDSKIGRVFDPVSQKEFPSLLDWSAAQAEEDEWSDLSNDADNLYGYDEEYY